VDTYLDKKSVMSAMFYADLLVSFSDDAEDYYRQANCFFFNREYKRTISLLQRQGLTKSHAKSLHLAAFCHLELSEWDECIEILSGAFSMPSMRADYCLLRGKAHLALEQRNQAKAQWLEALAADPKCIEAYDLLQSNSMITVEETVSLLNSLKYTEEDSVLKGILLAHIAKYNKSPQKHFTQLKNNYALEKSALVQYLQADSLYYNYNFQQCFQITNQIMKEDPYNHGNALLLHISSMAELQKKNELFLCSHQLSELMPDSALTFYAIGAYYYCIKSYDKARVYFSKATTNEPNFVHAWIGYGHIFALQDEHDQAMAAYRAAFRLTSNHMPPLCIGMELVRVKNFAQAEHFLSQAMKSNKSDPLVWNELGVIALETKEYQKAIELFQKAISLCGDQISDIWEATFTNLGHAQRKMRMYNEAIESYQKALNLAPKEAKIKASIFSSLGFTRHLTGDLESAITYYHQSLGYNPNDRFTLDVLASAISAFDIPF